jgi:hypothetical protein
MKKVTNNKLRLCWIIADVRREILFIPKEVKEYSRILSRGEAALYFKYKNRYPTFAEVIVKEAHLLPVIPENPGTL